MAAAAALLLSIPAYGKAPHLGSVLHSFRQERRIRADLADVVQRAGGRAALLACGPVQTNPSEAPLAAWTLRVPLSCTEGGRGKVVIVSPGSGDSAPAPALPAGARYRLVAAAGSVRLFESCRR